jgi:hypothetical protein
MADELRPGDRVEWNAHGGKWTRTGTAVGVVVRRLVRPTRIKGHEAKASPEHPQYLVRSERSGAEAAHKPSALRRLRSRRANT